MVKEEAFEISGSMCIKKGRRSECLDATHAHRRILLSAYRVFNYYSYKKQVTPKKRDDMTVARLKLSQCSNCERQLDNSGWLATAYTRDMWRIFPEVQLTNQSRLWVLLEARHFRSFLAIRTKQGRRPSTYSTIVAYTIMVRQNIASAGRLFQPQQLPQLTPSPS